MQWWIKNCEGRLSKGMRQRRQFGPEEFATKRAMLGGNFNVSPLKGETSLEHGVTPWERKEESGTAETMNDIELRSKKGKSPFALGGGKRPVFVPMGDACFFPELNFLTFSFLGGGNTEGKGEAALPRENEEKLFRGSTQHRHAETSNSIVGEKRRDGLGPENHCQRGMLRVRQEAHERKWNFRQTRDAETIPTFAMMRRKAIYAAIILTGKSLPRPDRGRGEKGGQIRGCVLTILT